ncbi:ABC-2 transporter permease [Listeria newyorkensis]|uniref:ABC-2 transporter permease n=1 Tax=Listeria newyorkensis TaxID=1497681 RepID=A0A841YVF4_9LIST|nr:ABC-2 transporter permease [Listeria newyorkensis]MBC1456952.1 ABC-2 transporter permease [Listeria newyorkensis]
MYALIRKDFRVQTKVTAYYLIFVVALLALWMNQGFVTWALYALGATMISMAPIFAALSYDDKSGELTAILPVSRGKIVIAKYISSLIFMIFAMVFIFISTLIIGLFIESGGGIRAHFVSIGFVLAGLCFFFAIVFPCYYWLGFHRLSYMYTALVVLFGAVLVALYQSDFGHWLVRYLADMSLGVLAGVLLVISIVAYAVSLCSSLRIFAKKDV